MRLHVAAGEGRVFATAHYVGYVSAPIDGLPELIERADENRDLFKRLAGLVVANDFELPNIVAVRLDESPAAFVFGPIALRTAVASALIDGASSSTWTERQLGSDDLTHLSCGNPVAALDEDCVLERGYVRGGGFRLGSPAPSLLPDQMSSHPDTAQTSTEPTPIGRVDDVPDDDDESDLDDIDLFPATDSVNLELIGVVTPRASSGVVHNAWDPPAPVDPEDGIDLATDAATQADHAVPAPTVAENAVPPAAPVNPAVSGPSFSGPVRPAPTSIPAPRPSYGAPSVDPIVPTDADETLPPVTNSAHAPVGRRATRSRLRFDDGQTIDFDAGVYVGRFPTKGGLPAGFESVVIRSEAVSRVHWSITAADDGSLFVEDLGSTMGTSVERPDGDGVASAGGQRLPVSTGDTIHFGDRWAVIER